MKIGIIGGCQVSGLRNWASALLDGVEVESWHVGINEASSPDRVLERLPTYDLVISQVADGSNGGRLEVSRIWDEHPTVMFIPTFVFSGFQPDICAVHELAAPHRQLKGLLGGLMSTIVVAAHYCGFSASEAEDLFNELVMAKLGYFDKFEASRHFAINAYEGCAIDISDDFDEWAERGTFMYSDNHPDIRVLGALAYRVLSLAGLSPKAINNVVCPADDLSLSVQWPVYPEIAKKLKIPGGG